jgi:hypothetical protein
MSRTLNIDPAIDSPDDFYQALIEAHRGLSDQGSDQLNCRLILLLANQIGDARILTEAIALARASLGNDAP